MAMRQTSKIVKNFTPLPPHPSPSKSQENVISEQETRDTSKPVKLTITQCYVSCKKKKKKLIYLVRVANGKIYMSLRV